jgi:hypothetical protein
LAALSLSVLFFGYKKLIKNEVKILHEKFNKKRSQNITEKIIKNKIQALHKKSGTKAGFF